MKALFSKTALTIAITSLGSFSVYAQTGVSPQSAQTEIQQPQQTPSPSNEESQSQDLGNEVSASSTPLPQNPNLLINQQINEFIRGEGKKYMEKKAAGQIYFGTETAAVMLDSSHKNWADARNMAFKEAMMKAQAKYLLAAGTSVSTESVRSMFSDPSLAPEITPEDLQNDSRLGAILDKALAVAGGELDQKLKEMGINPDEFKQAPTIKRAEIFKRSTATSTSLSAFQELSGMVPVQTFEAHNENGDFAVGVAVVASPKFSREVRELLESKGEIQPRHKPESQSIFERFSVDENLIHMYGIRKVVDQEGYPAFVSFAQAGNPYQGTDFQRQSDYQEMAFSRAENLAFANFAELYSSFGSLDKSSSEEIVRSTMASVQAEGSNIMKSEETATEFISKVNEQMRVRASIKDLAGVQQLHRWTQRHPVTNHLIHGVVYVWTPRAETNMRQLRDMRATPKSVNTTENTRPKGSAGTAQGMSVMSADDF